MKKHLPYILRYLMITGGISLIIIIIALLSPEMELSPIIILMFIFGCLFFSFVMGLFTGEMTGSKTAKNEKAENEGSNHDPL